MKTILTICAVVVMCAMAFVTSSTNAGTVNFTAFNGVGNHGELTMNTSGILGVPDLTGFGTFCVETTEFIDWPPSGPYNAVVNWDGTNSYAVMGSVGSLPGDSLNPETAWLFNELLNGNITLSTAADKAAFQEAIWQYEGEVGGQANSYYTMAAGKSLGGPGGIGGIRVLNLTDDSGNLKQDVLVPEPATIAVLGLGSLFLGLKKK
jgi:hypothetical protein